MTEKTNDTSYVYNGKKIVLDSYLAKKIDKDVHTMLETAEEDGGPVGIHCGCFDCCIRDTILILIPLISEGLKHELIKVEDENAKRTD